MSRKPYEVPDKALWDEVRQGVAPLAGVRRKSTKTLAYVPPPHAIMVAAPSAGATLARAPSANPPALASFDRRTAQKLGRGQLDPEARLDLHGESLENARFALLHFIASRRARGDRLVLIITGKGASPFARHTLHGHTHFHTPEREGKLRRELPLWLEEAQFRIHVVGFQPAHPRHGGGGAFYVRLRKGHSE